MKLTQPKAISALLDRIGGKGTAKRFVTRLDSSLAEEGKEVFCLAGEQGKPLIKGSSLSAISVGINWYLNHYAHVNLSWNQLTTDLTHMPLPLPEKEEKHLSQADYRYYLNYCTFGYSMSTWTWQRWEQEIDWMALHGINMPLQIVGLEAVWRNFLMLDCHFTEDQAEDFIPGPAYTAWWGMNNLEGWGGTHLNAWYARQTWLAQLICKRERELGMQPVLPGFSGMVPSQFERITHISTERANLWCQFQRPAILDPSSPEFSHLASCYYRRLHEVMGTSAYYSMDPFHEGGTISSGRYEEGYRAVFDAMQANCGDASRWVIQQWQWTAYQSTSLRAVPPGRLIVLDLFSDGRPAFEAYGGYAPQEAIYCVLPNYGGRTGFMGRLPRMAEGWFAYLSRYATIKGIGSAPEGIESVPIVYDLLYELPWMSTQPNIEAWVREYAHCRYGMRDHEAERAWLGILHTALNEQSSLQGPHETTMCARPSLQVDRVSSWGGTAIFYPAGQLTEAVSSLLKSATHIGTEGSLGASNMAYDIVDLLRQCLSDYSLSLLADIGTAHRTSSTSLFNTLTERFLHLLLDTDRLLATHRLFRLGHWTEEARLVAREVTPFLTRHERISMGRDCEEQIADWLEYDNARTLITIWGDQQHSEQGGLHDYSYRQWQGMLSDFYFPRWHYFFSHSDHPSTSRSSLSTPPSGWFASEWNWAHELQGSWGTDTKGTLRKTHPKRYSSTPEGDILTIAHELFHTYF